MRANENRKNKVILITVVLGMLVLAGVTALIIAVNRKPEEKSFAGESISVDKAMSSEIVSDLSAYSLNQEGKTDDQAGVCESLVTEAEVFDTENCQPENCPEIENEEACEKDDDMVRLCNEQIDDYNAAVIEYNNEVDRYKTLISSINEHEEFDTDMFVFAEKEYMKTADYSEWMPERDFASETDSIRTEKENIVSGYPTIYHEVLRVLAEDYNSIATMYNDIVQYVSTEYVNDLSSKANPKYIYSEKETENMSEERFLNIYESLLKELNRIVSDYKILTQIKQPSKDWVIDRLKDLPMISGIEAVTYNNDPNGLLGKDGGYCDCIYFSLKDIDAAKVPGNSIVEKGTDAGGAVEVYKKLEQAKNRCEYLSEFDGTLLYSGSYTLVGTMVIRTSYRLTNEEQVAVVNAIIERFTKLN